MLSDPAAVFLDLLVASAFDELPTLSEEEVREER